MNRAKEVKRVEHPDRVRSYFKLERKPLAIVALSGILYNVGMTAGPYFEGQLAGRLFDVMAGRKTKFDMVFLAGIYVAVIVFVQFMRYIKRFYVRRFANDTNRNMRKVLYHNIVHQSKTQLSKESVGSLMTKAVSDVDACVEGMRKFTTELFDTGIVLIAYMVMLVLYDWRLAILSSLFVPIAYVIAERLKKAVYRYTKAYKESAGRLNDATLDRVKTAMTYRIYGRENNRNLSYEEHLADYEKRAVRANIWENTMQPIYNIISMTGVLCIVYFGGRNVAGTGWTAWDIASFTTFLSCFSKMALKSSKAAKLFNAVQKAQVSWKRIKPLLKPYECEEEEVVEFEEDAPLVVSHLSFRYPEGEQIIHDLSFRANPGDVIGVTGPVASGKSTLGKVFLCESPYDGTITYGGCELSSMSSIERSTVVTYVGHDPELMSDTIEENIMLGEPGDIDDALHKVCLRHEIKQMEKGSATEIGSNGARLSGGQQARVALARALYQKGRILVLDDPFSAVDKKTEDDIMRHLRIQYEDRIILILSHRLTLFPEFDQVIWMNGKSERTATHSVLLKEIPEYKQLYEMQTKGGRPNET